MSACFHRPARPGSTEEDEDEEEEEEEEEEEGAVFDKPDNCTQTHAQKRKLPPGRGFHSAMCV